MTLMVKYLPWKSEEPRVDSQNLCTKLVARTCSLSNKGTEAGRQIPEAHWSVRLAELMSFVFN